MNLQNVILALVLKILPILIDNLSPALRQFIEQLIAELEKKAKETKNTYDDMFVELLKAIFNIKD